MNNTTTNRRVPSSQPAGRIKLLAAMGELITAKNFNSMTTAEIARTAGVNEALIYRYFGDKLGLLHAILSERIEVFMSIITTDLKGISGAINKLRKLIWSSIDFYSSDRIFAKILLLEVRSNALYFQSDTYNLAKEYSRLLLEIIKEGVVAGEIRDDVKPTHIRQIILGGMEHLVLPAIIYDSKFDVEELYEDLCNMVFKGIQKY